MISQQTYERVKVGKNYIEKKYRMKISDEVNKKKEWDIINQKIRELQLSSSEAESIKSEIKKKEAENLRNNRKKITVFEFEPLTIIGKGAFGEVRICRDKTTKELVAIKKMKKDEMHKKNQVMHIRSEKEVLSISKNPWVVGLRSSFQDENYLYLVMDYLAGGDLMTLLMARDILTEDESKFYAAELVLSIESVHKLNCIHRDLKPDNVLIGKDGHIKLSDFDGHGHQGISGASNFTGTGTGTSNSKNLFNSIKGSRKRRILAHSTVGTPDYIAPEVFEQKGYGPEVDWWSLGVILFEMLIGYPPFFSENAGDTCKKILSWRKNLVIPSDAKISKDSADIIKRLMTDVDKRLGYNGADEVKSHPFFKGIDWNNIEKSLKVPFTPELKHALDTKYFDEFPDDEPFYPIEEEKEPNPFSKDVCFLDFNYNRDLDNPNMNLENALEIIENVKVSKGINQNPSNSRTDTKSSEGNSSHLNKQNSEDGSVDKRLPTDPGNHSNLHSLSGLTKKGTSDFLIKSKELMEKMGIHNTKDFSSKIQSIKQQPNTTKGNVKIGEGKINTQTGSLNDLKKTSVTAKLDMSKQITVPLDKKEKPFISLHSEKKMKIPVASGAETPSFAISGGLGGTSNVKQSSNSKPKINLIPRTQTHNNMHNQILKNMIDSKENHYLNTEVNEDSKEEGMNKYNRILHTANTTNEKLKVLNSTNGSKIKIENSAPSQYSRGILHTEPQEREKSSDKIKTSTSKGKVMVTQPQSQSNQHINLTSKLPNSNKKVPNLVTKTAALTRPPPKNTEKSFSNNNLVKDMKKLNTNVKIKIDNNILNKPSTVTPMNGGLSTKKFGK